MRKILLMQLLIILTYSVAYAQGSYTVKGVIVDSQNMTIPGASIIEKGTTFGVVSNIDGEFSIDVKDANSRIEISYLGYKQRDLIASSPLFSQPIVLVEDAIMTDELVVIAYGTVKKNDLTGSVSTIKINDKTSAVYTSPQQMLLGKVPGVSILPGDGGPGSGSTIRIRGASSLNASNDPLIVIDGVPIENNTVAGLSNPLSTINPNDIESFTILKDASSTAIYGSRASNGVIIITTKKGTSGKLRISYNSTYSIAINTKDVDVLSAADYTQFMLEAYPESTTNGEAVRKLIGDKSTDWQKLIYQPAFATNQNLSFYGAVKEWLPYRVSLGYTNEEGTIKTSKYERATANINLKPMFFDKHLTINLNANGTFNRNNFANSGAVNAAADFDPTQGVHFRVDDGNIDCSRSNGWWNWINYSGGTPNPDLLAGENPMSMLYDNYNRSNVYRVVGNVQVDYKMHFLPDLRANVNVGIDRVSSATVSGTNKGSFSALKDTDFPGLGKYEDKDEIKVNKILEAYLSYSKDIKKHHFDIMGGYSWQHFYEKNDAITIANETGEIYFDSPQFESEYFLISFFGRLNYSYDEKYLFTATLRNDASSRFSKDNRWGLFPSLALAWNITEEDWMQGSSEWLSDLKLRASWGTTGQQNINQGNYPYIPRYTLYTNPGTSYPINGSYVNILQPNGYNPDIKWETTETINIGLDYGFFDNRLSGSVDVYRRETRDLLNIVPIPLGPNFTNAILSNIGNMKNQGLELAINAVPIQTKDWGWTIGANATWQDIEITKLTASGDEEYSVGVGGISSGTGSTIQVHKVGHAPFSFYTYQQVYGQDGLPLQNTFVDRNGDGEITNSDLYISGKSPNPDVFLGFNSTLSYRNWSLGINAHASVGNWAYNDYYAGNSTPYGNITGYLVNVPEVAFKSGFKHANENAQVYSDMFLEDASFLKIDDITLGYSFNNIIYNKVNLNLAFSVQNVCTITGYSGLDPENSGIDNNIWPRPRTFTLRLGFDF